MKTYRIVEMHHNGRPPTVKKTGLSLKEAQDHCRCEDTYGDGWFDEYEEETT